MRREFLKKLNVKRDKLRTKERKAHEANRGFLMIANSKGFLAENEQQREGQRVARVVAMRMVTNFDRAFTFGS